MEAVDVLGVTMCRMTQPARRISVTLVKKANDTGSTGSDAVALRDAQASSTVPIQYRPLEGNKKRVLQELERLVGNQTYNASIQNWGPGGVFLGEGREYRYPVTMINAQGDKLKRPSLLGNDVSGEMIKGAFYAFGANRLHIGMGLLKVIEYLEQNYGLNLDDAPAEGL